MEIYNQTKQKDTKYACTVYTFLNIMLLDYWVKIKDWYAIKFVYYLEKVGALILTQWAVFSVIYPIMVKYVNVRYWINLKIKTSSISQGLDEISSWSLWLKKLTIKWQKLGTSDWEFTKEDVDMAIKFNNAYWHNHLWKKWVIVDSYGAVDYKCNLDTLKYGVTKDLYYDTWRAIIPGDSFTQKVKDKLIEKAKFTKRWATEEELSYIIKNMK